MKLTRKTFMCTETQLEMMSLIKEKYGLKTLTGVFDKAISDCYRSSFKYGSDPISDSVSKINGSSAIEERAKRRAMNKIAEKKAERDLELQPKKDFCINVLGGEVVEQSDGSYVCNWQNHDTYGSTDQSIQLTQVGDYLLNSLYVPDKETVLKARPELKNKK